MHRGVVDVWVFSKFRMLYHFDILDICNIDNSDVMFQVDLSRDFFIDKRIYQEVDIDHCGCRHFPWGRRRA